MICAAPGHVLIGADFSAIESRVLAWVAGERGSSMLIEASTLHTIRATSLIAKQQARFSMCKPATTQRNQRNVGKTCDLAFGYQGGIDAWRKFSRIGSQTMK